MENSRFSLDSINAEDFQAHLETRIPEYLVSGDWWYHDVETNDIVFRDGDNEPEYRACGPQIKSCTDWTIAKLQQ